MNLPRINAWKYRFSRRIIDRGEDYYLNGQIDSVEETVLGWRATAHGTRDYEVRIIMNDQGRVFDMHCSCPYAKNGSRCKHMAALLFQISEEEDPYPSGMEGQNTGSGIFPG